jgi:hypothetical protein
LTRRAERIGYLIAISAHDLFQSQVSRSSTIHRESSDRPGIPITYRERADVLNIFSNEITNFTSRAWRFGAVFAPDSRLCTAPRCPRANHGSDIRRQYHDAGVQLLSDSDYRNGSETNELIASDIMPHFA